MPESTPLLSFNSPSRKHFLDNIRVILTFLLVIQHVLIETVSAGLAGSTGIAVIVAANKAFLWSSFFFVSGYSTSLAIAFRSSNRRVFLDKTSEVMAPALLYALLGHFMLFSLLSGNWDYIFGNSSDLHAYARLSGPVGYVLFLLILDGSAFIFRKVSFPSWMSLPSSPTIVMLLTLSTLTLYTLLNSALILPNIVISPKALASISYDIPNASFPLSHIIAYYSGWRFRSLKRTVISSSSLSATFGLVASSALSIGSLAYAQSYWPAIAQLIQHDFEPTPVERPVLSNGKINAPTVFFAFWSTFTWFAISISLFSLFYHSSLTTKSWGWFGRNTYVQTYVHMIAILVAEYHLKRVRNFWVRLGLMGFVSIIGTWVLAFAVYLVFGYMKWGYREARRRMRW